jgi:Periplasmic binding protein
MRPYGSPTRKGRLALLGLALLAAACDSGNSGRELGLRDPQPTPTGTDTRIVGLVGTMSGPDSWRGEDAYEGADLGVHSLNRAAERPYELVTLDDRGDPARAQRLIGRLALLSRVAGIIFAGPTGGLEGAEESLAEAGIPLFACYGAAPDRAHIFAMAPRYRVQARRLVTYATEDRGYQTLGLLAEKGDGGRGVTQSVRSSAEGGRGIRLLVARYAPGGLAHSLGSLRAAGVEGVLVHATPPGYTSILRALRREGAGYRSTAAARRASAPPAVRAERSASGWWHPQVLGFELAVDRRVEGEQPGFVAAGSYDRGAFYLPLPAFRRWRRAFSNWWEKPPYGWQWRAYSAARLIGVAADEGGDGARALEQAPLRSRPGIDLAPSDHEVPSPSGVGLWVVPRRGLSLPDERHLPRGFPWVPLARGFAAGARTRLPPAERPALFPSRVAKDERPPLFSRQEWGVTTESNDPIY